MICEHFQGVKGMKGEIGEPGEQGETGDLVSVIQLYSCIQCTCTLTTLYKTVYSHYSACSHWNSWCELPTFVHVCVIGIYRAYWWNWWQRLHWRSRTICEWACVCVLYQISVHTLHHVYVRLKNYIGRYAHTRHHIILAVQSYQKLRNV